MTSQTNNVVRQNNNNRLVLYLLSAASVLYLSVSGGRVRWACQRDELQMAALPHFNTEVQHPRINKCGTLLSHNTEDPDSAITSWQRVTHVDHVCPTDG